MFGLTACAEMPEADQLAEDTREAMADAESYRFDAQFQIWQAGPEGEQEGTAAMVGAFAAPDRMHIHVSGEQPLLDEPFEVVFYENDVYVRTNGAWQETAIAQLGIIQGAPSHERLDEWIAQVVEQGTAEASRTELDGRDVYSLRGEWSWEDTDEHTDVQLDGSFELWIGTDDSLVRRASYEITTVIVPMGNEDLEVTVRTAAEEDFSDYNEEVAIPTP